MAVIKKDGCEFCTACGVIGPKFSIAEFQRWQRPAESKCLSHHAERAGHLAYVFKSQFAFLLEHNR